MRSHFITNPKGQIVAVAEQENVRRAVVVEDPTLGRSIAKARERAERAVLDAPNLFTHKAALEYLERLSGDYHIEWQRRAGRERRWVCWPSVCVQLHCCVYPNARDPRSIATADADESALWGFDDLDEVETRLKRQVAKKLLASGELPRYQWGVDTGGSSSDADRGTSSDTDTTSD